MQFRNLRNMSLGHPRILLRSFWRRDVKSPLVGLGTYCGNYVINIYSYYNYSFKAMCKIQGNKIIGQFCPPPPKHTYENP